MKVQSSENKLVITEEFVFDQNKLTSDPNNHFKDFTRNWSVFQVLFKVKKRAKIRNQYNQKQHLTQDTNGKVTRSQLDITNKITRQI